MKLERGCQSVAVEMGRRQTVGENNSLRSQQKLEQAESRALMRAFMRGSKTGNASERPATLTKKQAVILAIGVGVAGLALGATIGGVGGSQICRSRAGTGTTAASSTDLACKNVTMTAPSPAASAMPCNVTDLSSNLTRCEAGMIVLKANNADLTTQLQQCKAKPTAASTKAPATVKTTTTARPTAKTTTRTTTTTLPTTQSTAVATTAAPADPCHLDKSSIIYPLMEKMNKPSWSVQPLSKSGSILLAGKAENEGKASAATLCKAAELAVSSKDFDIIITELNQYANVNGAVLPSSQLSAAMRTCKSLTQSIITDFKNEKWAKETYLSSLESRKTTDEAYLLQQQDELAKTKAMPASALAQQRMTQINQNIAEVQRKIANFNLEIAKVKKAIEALTPQIKSRWGSFEDKPRGEKGSVIRGVLGGIYTTAQNLINSCADLEDRSHFPQAVADFTEGLSLVTASIKNSGVPSLFKASNSATNLKVYSSFDMLAGLFSGNGMLNIGMDKSTLRMLADHAQPLKQALADFTQAIGFTKAESEIRKKINTPMKIK